MSQIDDFVNELCKYNLGNKALTKEENESIHRDIREIAANYKNEKFVVVIDGYYTRDGQVFCPENLEIPRDKEDCSDELYDRYEQDADWRDICHKDIYLGIYDWADDDIAGLLAYVGKKHGYPEGILQAYQV